MKITHISHSPHLYASYDYCQWSWCKSIGAGQGSKRQSYGNSIRLTGLVETPAGERPASTSPPRFVVSALHLRGRCSRAQQYTLIQGWRGAETAPVLRPLSKPPATFRGTQISQEYSEQNNQIKNQADRESYGNK